MALGIVILVATLADVFLTALNYDEAGFIAGPLAALQWRMLRKGTRKMSRRWRPTALRQVTGLQLMTTVLTWIGGVILGYGLIYYGNMHGDNFEYSGAHPGPFAAIYYSAAQLSTVGTSQLTPNTEVLSALSIAETLTGVVLVSLILTFLFGVYDVISSLLQLCSTFYSAQRGAGDAISSLEPFFPHGEPTGLDSRLQGISDALGSYTDGLRLHHAAYYFQSGSDQFALPYALGMLSGVVSALRWGVPSGQLASLQPDLIPLTSQLNKFGDYIHPFLQWKSTDVPELLDSGAFHRAYQAPPGSHDADPWVTEFAQLNAGMARLTRSEGASTDTPGADDLQDRYLRYTQWLPFAHRMRHLNRSVSRDLDYQPIIVMSAGSSRGSVSPPVAAPTLTTPERVQSVGDDDWELPAQATHGRTPDGARDAPLTRWWHGWRAFLRDRTALVDPGYTRLLSAARAVLAAGFAAATILLTLDSFDTELRQVTIFGGMVAIFASAVSSRGIGPGRKVTALLAVVPVTIAILVTAVPNTSAVVTSLGMVVIALVGTWVARFGLRWGALGQLLFITYYFALLMNLRNGELLPHVIAGAVGVAWAFLFAFVIIPDRPGRVARDGVAAFEQRLAATLDPLIDAVSWSRWDPDLASRVQRDTLQLHRSAAFLTGQLTAANSTLGLTPTQVSALRLRVFDLELAAVILADAARQATGAGMPITMRGRLAGELELLQEHLRTYSKAPAWARGTRPPDRAPVPASQSPTERLLAYTAPATWPEQARRLHRTARELLRAADALNTVHAYDLVGPEEEGADQPSASPAAPPAPTAPPTTGTVQHHENGIDPTTRRAVQAAASTGLALSLGSLVSSTHQYWAAMPAYQVLGGTDGETFVKATRRIIGTIAGAVIGFAIAIEWGSNHAVTVPLLVLCAFAGAYFRSTSSPLTTFWQTMLFAQLYELLGKLTTEAVAVRILETVIGAVVALSVARLILPIHTRNKLNDDLVDLVGSLSSAASASLHRLGGADVPVQTLRSRGLAVNQQLRKVTGTAAPLRRATGTLELGGIEGTLTAMWSIVFFSRNVLRAASDPHVQSSAVPAQEWARVTAITLGNLEALSAAFRGERPDDVPGSLDLDGRILDDPALPRPTERVLHELDKLNEAVLLLLGETLPSGLEPPASSQDDAGQSATAR